MTRSIVRAALVAAALLLPGRMLAQAPLAGVIGDTVRVRAPAIGAGIRGVLVAVRNDTLFVRRYGVTLPVPLSQVEWVDVRRKRSLLGGLARGVAYGAPIGLASGYLLGAAAESGDGYCGDDCGLLPVVGAATGFAAGTFLGAIIGLGAPGGRWVPVSARPSIAVAPARGGVALSLNAKL